MLMVLYGLSLFSGYARVLRITGTRTDRCTDMLIMPAIMQVL